MDNLRWVLLLIGIVIVVMVYVFSRFNVMEKVLAKLRGLKQPELALTQRLRALRVRTAGAARKMPLHARREPAAFGDAGLDLPVARDDVDFHVSDFHVSDSHVSDSHVSDSNADAAVHPRQREPHILASDWHEPLTASIPETTYPALHREESAADDIGPAAGAPTASDAGAARDVLRQGLRKVSGLFEPPASHPPRQDTLPLDIQPLLLVLSVITTDQQRFSAADVVAALEAEGLQYGDMQIFHYIVDGYTDGYVEGYADSPPVSPVRPVFSVANILEPGTFDPASLPHMLTPGITLFCQLPGALAPGEAFTRMLDTARRIAARLQGRVCDDRRNTLTSQRLAHYQDRIAAYTRELLLAQKS